MARYIYSRNLAVGEVQNINFGGTYFYVIEADGPIRIGVNDSDGDEYEVGTGPVGMPEDRFAKLKITNTHTAAQTVKIIVGKGEFRDSRFSLVPGRYVGIPMYPAPTRVVVNAATTIAAGASVNLPGTWAAPDRIRKAIIVQNLDPGQPLQIRVGTAIMNVVPGSPVPITHTFEVSGPVTIYNPGGAPVECAISEIVVTG